MWMDVEPIKNNLIHLKYYYKGKHMNFSKVNFATISASGTCATTGCNAAPYDGGDICCYYYRVKMSMPVD